MAEYDKRRLYWIKLTDRFISSDTVDFLMSQKDGANYVVLYQMLCLKTVNNGGVLARELGELIVPYDVDKIQRDCKWFSPDTVRVALELYKKLGLVYENTDGILAITDFEKMIGSQTYSAEKKELQRQKHNEELLLGGQVGGQKVDNCPPDIDIYKKKDKDTYFREKNKSKERVFNPPHAPTLEEVKKYCDERGNNIDADKFYDYYTSIGWMSRGNIPIRDWKTKVRYWEKTEHKKTESSFDTNEFFQAALNKSYGG